MIIILRSTEGGGGFMLVSLLPCVKSIETIACTRDDSIYILVDLQ